MVFDSAFVLPLRGSGNRDGHEGQYLHKVRSSSVFIHRPRLKRGAVLLVRIERYSGHIFVGLCPEKS